MAAPPYLESASTLIKSLRAASDPPIENGPKKIEIAREAWAATNFHVPRKAEVLRDWVVETWSRAGIAPLQLISTFFTTLSTEPPFLFNLAADSFSNLFRPDGVHKAEAWVDVWATMMKYLSDAHESPTLLPINAQTAIATYPMHAQAYLRHPALRDMLNHTIAAVLFHPSFLLTDPLRVLLKTLTSPIPLDAISPLFNELVSIYHSTRFNLFAQASSSKVAHDVFVASKEREAVRVALEAVIWRVVARWGGYMERESAWGRLVEHEARKAEAALTNSDCLGSVLEVLATLEQLDHDQTRLSQDTPPAHHATAAIILSSLLRFHQLTHSIPTFFSLIITSIQGLFNDNLPDDAVRSLYQLTVSGPLLSRPMREQLVAALRSTVPGKRRSSAWDSIFRSLFPDEPITKKRKRSEHSSAAAARTAIHSRLISYSLQSATDSEDPEDILPPVDEYIGDLSTKPRSWSQSIANAAKIRVSIHAERLLLRPLMAVEELSENIRDDSELRSEASSSRPNCLYYTYRCHLVNFAPVLLFLADRFPKPSDIRVSGDTLPRLIQIVESGLATPLWVKVVSFSVELQDQLATLGNSTMNALRPLLEQREVLPAWNIMYNFYRWLGLTHRSARHAKAALELLAIESTPVDEIVCFCVLFFDSFPDQPQLVRTALRAGVTDLQFASAIVEEKAVPETFRSVVHTITVLTRRRPELILSALPELVEVICALFTCLQTSPAISRKQAQLLSRLLVLLAQTRLGTNHETSPLAKHIPAIFVAYVRAGTDLHSGYTTSVRRELEPGLFALCSLVTSGGRVNSRGREGEGLAVPFGLGEGIFSEGERDMYADLWKSWSKARYTGQG
ncbi:hypothetical protein CI109_105291 [Kwoniella shandongensis]|uniref:Nucleolar 27S pre-rRNA processing Urb2/Npa2 C-terminal domain-containing protein n=1 Tax=Kwoniella shandongensis TaxID=1734106 RepID=A0AAJ8LQ74_9TREE